MSMRWYVVHAYSQYENSVKKAMVERIARAGLQDKFGDILVPGAAGRLISILIMIGGVSLFFRLIQVVMRPNKVRYPCPSCGLTRHEPDAVHCKACGQLLCIVDDND